MFQNYNQDPRKKKKSASSGQNISEILYALLSSGAFGGMLGGVGSSMGKFEQPIVAQQNKYADNRFVPRAPQVARSAPISRAPMVPAGRGMIPKPPAPPRPSFPINGGGFRP